MDAASKMFARQLEAKRVLHSVKPNWSRNFSIAVILESCRMPRGSLCLHRSRPSASAPRSIQLRCDESSLNDEPSAGLKRPFEMASGPRDTKSRLDAASRHRLIQ